MQHTREDQKCLQNNGRKSKGKISLERPYRTWKNTLKYLRKIDRNVWIWFTRFTVESNRRAHMDKAMKFRVPWKTGNLLTSWAIQIQYTAHSINLGHRIHLHHTATHISGRRLGLNSSPTVWIGRMASVWVNHVKLWSAPWSLREATYVRTHCPYRDTNSALSGHSSAITPHPAVTCFLATSAPSPSTACLGILSHSPQFSIHHTLTTSPLCFHRPAQKAFFRAI
jgi:hypothetical protein